MNLRHTLLSLALLSALPLAANAERGFEVRDLAKLDRVSAPVLSPDGRKVVFAKRVVDFDANKSATSLWIEDLFARDAAPPVRLTPEGWNVNSATFSDDGTRVYFLSAKGGSMQLYAIPVAGGTPVQLTDVAGDVGGYVVSPDGKRVALALETFADCKSFRYIRISSQLNHGARLATQCHAVNFFACFRERGSQNGAGLIRLHIAHQSQ